MDLFPRTVPYQIHVGKEMNSVRSKSSLVMMPNPKIAQYVIFVLLKLLSKPWQTGDRKKGVVIITIMLRNHLEFFQEKAFFAVLQYRGLGLGLWLQTSPGNQIYSLQIWSRLHLFPNGCTKLLSNHTTYSSPNHLPTAADFINYFHKSFYSVASWQLHYMSLVSNPPIYLLFFHITSSLPPHFMYAWLSSII